LKQHQEWSDEECLRYLDQRKIAKIQWVLGPKQSNADDLRNVRCEGSRHFRNIKKAYLKAKIDELETNSKIKNIKDLFSGINDSKEVYQIPKELIKAGGRTIPFEIRKLINSIWNKDEMPKEWKESIIVNQQSYILH
jgi:predicted  nucleic acid-binding Zn-ribbon protein